VVVLAAVMPTATVCVATAGPVAGSGLPAGGGVDGVLVNGQLCWARLYRDSDPDEGWPVAQLAVPSGI
jgi:hypothetical protein